MSSFRFDGQPQNGLQQFTVEYLEHMRCFCKGNGYDVQKLFEEDDPQKVGCVQDFIFLYIIYKKFSGQIGFSIEQVRLICNYFRVPDGSICYMRLHFLMKSDENVVDQIRKATQIPFSAVGASTGYSTSTATSYPYTFLQTNAPVKAYDFAFLPTNAPAKPYDFAFLPTTPPATPISPPSFQAQKSTSPDRGVFQHFDFSSTPLQQQQPNSPFGSTATANTTTTGVSRTCTPIKDVSTGGFSTPASHSVSAPGFSLGSGTLPSGNRPAVDLIDAQMASISIGNRGKSTSNVSTFGSPSASPFGGGGSTFSSLGSSTPNSGSTNCFVQSSSDSGHGFSFGTAASPTSANNVATPSTSGGPTFGHGFNFGASGTVSRSASTFVNPSTSGRPTQGFFFGREVTPFPGNNSETADPTRSSGFSFGSKLSPMSENKSETAGPTLPAFTHGLSQQSTNTVTKILGSNQNQPSAQESASGSWGFGGISSTATYSGGFGSLNAASNGTTGVGSDMLGGGDAINANSGAATNASVEDTIKDGGGAQTDPGGSEGLPKEEPKQSA